MTMKLSASVLLLQGLLAYTELLRQVVLDRGLKVSAVDQIALTQFLPPSVINLSAPSFHIPDRALNKDAAAPEAKDHRFYLYQRVKLPMDKDHRVGLHFGLNSETFTSEPIAFVPDIASTHTMVNLNNNRCVEENTCFSLETSEDNVGRYMGKDYKYFVGQSFLGVNRVRPGELDITSVKEVPDFYQLPIRFFDNVLGLNFNTLGLAPNSPLWAYWAHVYHFPSKFINLSFSFNRENEYVMFDSAINHETEVLFRASKKNPFFMFQGSLEIKNTPGAKTQPAEGSGRYPKVDICVANRADTTMRLNQVLFEAIKASLCESLQSCSKAKDLKAVPDYELELKMDAYNGASKFFLEIFFPSAFYHLENDNIVWKIDRQTPEEVAAGCQLVLDQGFLRQKYLLISNDIEDKEFIYIGFRLMELSDFYKFDFYTVTIILLVLASLSLIIVYFVLNHSLKKLLRRENLEA